MTPPNEPPEVHLRAAWSSVASLLGHPATNAVIIYGGACLIKGAAQGRPMIGLPTFELLFGALLVIYGAERLIHTVRSRRTKKSPAHEPGRDPR
jgi:UDP-glucoronosyl/UDP-glucosyl transferase